MKFSSLKRVDVEISSVRYVPDDSRRAHPGSRVSRSRSAETVERESLIQHRRVRRRKTWRWDLVASAWCAVGCGSTQPQPLEPTPEVPHRAVQSRWQGVTVAPQPGGTQDEFARQLLRLCQAEDAGLNRVALLLAEHQATDYSLPETDEVNFELRVAGVPNVWPHAWAIVGKPSLQEAKQGMGAWLQSFNDGGQRRCGVGQATSLDGKTVVAALALDAIADLKPLPQQAHLGQWIQLEAHLLSPASAAEVVVLGPFGPPRTVPATLHQDVIKSSFAVDQPGAWKIQVLPTLANGPRPALEALIYVDQQLPATFHDTPAPGEQSTNDEMAPAEALFAMISRARESEQLPPLAFSKELEAAAQIQADAMAERQLLAHDVGLGTPTDRLLAVGITPLLAGENVAHAKSIVRAHRALWSSPSHRSNLLHPEFTHAGVGVAEGPDGTLWVCVVFATLSGHARSQAATPLNGNSDRALNGNPE